MFISNSYSQYVFQPEAIPQKISLHPYTSIVDVGQDKLEIQQLMARFSTLNPKVLASDNDDLGFTNNYFWGKISLKNASKLDLHYYFETARPITDRVELYVVNRKAGKIIKSVSGDNIPFDQRAYANRKTIFKLHIPPQTSLDLFLHLKSDGEVIKMPVVLHSSDSFNRTGSFEQFIFGIFYGILLIATIIYFFFYFALKELSFLYYSLYVFFVSLMQLSLDGYFYKYFTPDGGWLSQHSVLLFAMVTGVLLGKYSAVFLKIKEHNKRIHTMFNVVFGLAFVLIGLIVFVPAAMVYCYPIANILGLFILLLIISSIVVLLRAKVNVDSFFTCGILFLVLGFGVFILNNFGILPSTFLIQNSSKFGTGLEIIFLSLSMANLIRNLKNEKNELNRLALVRSEEMNDLKSYFLSNISHELRTPLNAIMNLIDAVSNEVEDEKIKKNCQVIKYSSHSLLSSVNDILDFSKIEKKEIKLDQVAFNPLSTITQVAKSVELRALDKGLDFSFIQHGVLPSLIIGDEARLAQIINNVLSNAIKFTAEGYIKFEVKASEVSATHTRFLFTITDSGVGISKDKMATIFDSFTQHNIDNKRKFGGLGLGLYIVKTLVDLQEGTVTMNSYLRKGTTCAISLDFETVAPSLQEIVAIEPEVYDLKGKTVLVVEDNSVNQMVIKMIMKKWANTKVLFANNGQEGLDALKANKIDIVLMDLQMPVMDGYEATIAIRNGEAGLENSSIPIIAVTADVMEGTKTRVIDIGMNDYLSKPVKKETLYQTMQQVFNSVLIEHTHV
ncbi:hybrid sensor histidine kinase/response regulator [Flavobacterium sp. UMI-01]|nr:hybrid sensor histidine kinase/response regulator [Flavobacterium sp. UMI-01]